MMQDLKQRALPGRLEPASIAALTGADRAGSRRGDRVMDVRAFHSRRRFAETPCGRISYVEQGEGPVAVFLHGMPLNGFHWRHVIAGMSDVRRCIAPDLMGAGYSEIAPGQDLSFAAQAAMVTQFIDALGVDTIDLIGNDTGGAVAQIFAVNHAHRLRTLTLTNCDVHDNWPPPGALPLIEAARLGTLAEGYRALLGDVEAARARFARVYADPGFITEEVLRVYFEPVLWSEQRKADFHRYWLSFDPQQTISIEPRLRTLSVPTLIVWALNDVFFAPKWGQWLRDTIPGAVDLVKVPDARLFFAEDRPAALIQPLRAFTVSRE